MKWLIGFLVVLAALAGVAWYGVIDGAAPSRADGEFDLAAYRALVAGDAPETLPESVRVEFVGRSQAPSYITEAGAFHGDVAMTYTAFQITGPSGAIVIDGAIDAATAAEMTEGEDAFSPEAYQRVLDATAQASQVLITHEHLDHVMAIARHPEPDAIAARLRLTQPQLAGLPQHAPNGVLAPSIANAPPSDFTTPQRIAPGVVAHAAPGHTPGTVVIYARTPTREYLLVGDIVWVMSSIENLRGRPRAIHWIMNEIDPDRPAVLRQIRALHDIAAANPGVVILPSHDDAYLSGLVGQGVLTEGFSVN